MIGSKMTSPCRQMIYYFVTPVFGWMAVVLILHFTLYQSSKPPSRHERPVILDVTMTNIDSYKRDVYLDWGGTPIISSKFIYGNAKSLLHSAVFFSQRHENSRCKFTRAFFGFFPCGLCRLHRLKNRTALL